MCLLLDDANTKQAWGWKQTVKHTAAPMTEGGERTKTPEIGAHGPGPVASGNPPRAQPNGLKLRAYSPTCISSSTCVLCCPTPVLPSCSRMDYRLSRDARPCAATVQHSIPTTSPSPISRSGKGVGMMGRGNHGRHPSPHILLEYALYYLT